MKKPLALLGITAIAVSANAAEFVANGDFELGATGFTSGYLLMPPGTGSLTSPATYTVDVNPIFNHPSWTSFGDHTSGSGKMFLANGSTTASLIPWHEHITDLVIGETYTFSAWGASTYSFHPATLQLKINGTIIDTEAMSPTPGLWLKMEGTWVADTTSADLDIHDLITFGDGNDFAIDDVSFTGTAVPEPATLAIVGTGLFALLRRRRRS